LGNRSTEDSRLDASWRGTHRCASSPSLRLAGDSYAGKTCIARRLVEDRYEADQSSTYAMRVWTLAPEKLHESSAAPPGQSREIFVWDLGGQNEYQLVNQLFIHGSAVALVLFDASRGAVGLESARAWNQRLATRANPSVRKFLIRSKTDLGGSVVRHKDSV
jgi:GTPase SAR1 family protein